MGFLFGEYGYMRLDGYEWRASVGGCFGKSRKYRKACGYTGGKKYECVSTLTGHTCKHMVNGNQKEKEALLREGLVEEETIQEADFELICQPNAHVTEETNHAIKFYKMASEKSLEHVEYAIASNGNVLLRGTDRFDGFKTVINQSDKTIRSFYLDEDFKADTYCFYKLIERICWDETKKEYAIPEKTPGWIRLDAIAYDGNGWLNYCTNGCLGMSERVEYAFTEMAENIQTVREQLCNIVFHFHFNKKNHNEIAKLKEKRKTKDIIKGNKGRLLELIHANHALGQDGIEHLDEEKIYPYSFGLDPKTDFGPLFTIDEWKGFVPYFSEDYKSLKRNLKTFMRMIRDEEDNPDFVVDTMAQSIAMELYSLKLLRRYAHERVDDLVELEKEASEESHLKRWLDFYSFWEEIDWKRTPDIIKKTLDDSAVDDLLKAEVKEEFSKLATLSAKYITDADVEYYFDYETGTVKGTASVKFTICENLPQKDDEWDPPKEYDGWATIAFEMDLLTDASLLEVEVLDR